MSFRKHVLVALAGLTAIAALSLFCRETVDAQQPMALKLATSAEQHLSAGKGFGKFADLVNERA